MFKHHHVIRMHERPAKFQKGGSLIILRQFVLFFQKHFPPVAIEVRSFLNRRIEKLAGLRDKK